jgi:hypothetical protein
LDEPIKVSDLPEYKYVFEPIVNENVRVNKSMLDVLTAVKDFGGAEIFGDARLLKSLLSDLLPGSGQNAGTRNILNAAAAQIKANPPREADPAGQERLAQALIDQGYQPKLAREAASCFWTIL